jgi:hypothetical protein
MGLVLALDEAVVGFGIGVAWAVYRLWRSVALDMLSAEAILYARMARLVYNEPAARRCSELARAGFVLDSSCSSTRAAVFHHATSQTVVFAFRGTASVSAIVNSR